MPGAMVESEREVFTPAQPRPAKMKNKSAMRVIVRHFMRLSPQFWTLRDDHEDSRYPSDPQIYYSNFSEIYPKRTWARQVPK